ncbi:MAG: hypothetical protein DRP29_06815 [Thermodesulfobacteriota bacterium]|nr:MAG: hypothetical protein DRP29_06815 [Thermodesulfobacteriota bacterium]
MRVNLKYSIFFIFFLFLCFFYLDKKIILFLKTISPYFKNYFFILEVLNDIIVILYKSFVVGVILLGVYSYFFLNKKRGKDLILGIIWATLIAQTKHLLGRARPKITYETIFKGPSLKYAYASFPSGHTLFVFTLATVLSHYYPRYKSLWYAFAVLVALERLLNFAHFPSDLFVGAFIGIFLGKKIISKDSKEIFKSKS